MNRDEKQPARIIQIIVGRSSLDGVYPGLPITNDARMEGIKAHMFALKNEDPWDRADEILTVGQFYDRVAGPGRHVLFT